MHVMLGVSLRARWDATLVRLTRLCGDTVALYCDPQSRPSGITVICDCIIVTLNCDIAQVLRCHCDPAL